MRVTTIRELLVDDARFVVAPETTLAEAFEAMTDLASSTVHVARDGILMGTLTERDLIRHVSQYGGLSVTPVVNVMRTDSGWTETRGSLSEAAGAMQDCGLDHLPVIDLTGRIAGVLRLSDVPEHYLDRPRWEMRAKSAAAH